MTILESAFTAQVNVLLGEEYDELALTSRTAEVRAAIERYSHDKPDILSKDVTGDGGNYYTITSLTSWSEGFSQIVSIEYPAATIASDEAPVMLQPDDWNDDYWSGATRYLYLPNHAPVATESMRIRYTAPYALATGAYDVPPADFYAVCTLAAGLCAQAIAAKYSRSLDSIIAADSVNHMTRAEQWARRAKDWLASYEQHMGIDSEDDREQAAGEFVDWDTEPSSTRRWLYH